MGYSQDNGYIPLTIEEIIDELMGGINIQFGTSYTTESFIGTNFYKFFYVLAQKVQSNEIKLSEIFLKLQEYFDYTNEMIINPKVTPSGLIQIFADSGYAASVKPPEVGDAGKLYVCVNVDSGAPDYATKRLAICNIIKDNTAAGVVSQGAESETIVLSNGQSFDFKFNLPDIKETYLKLTLTTSRNNQVVIDTPDDIKDKLMDNIEAVYKLGKDFEPETYYTSEDAPYAADILLEYSFNDINYFDATYESDYDEFLDVGLDRIEIIQV